MAGRFAYVPLAVALTASPACSSPFPPPFKLAVTSPAVPLSVALATSGVIEGRAWYINAATPETMAAAWDVPVPFM